MTEGISEALTEEVEIAANNAEMLETNARLEADLVDARPRADEMMDRYQRMAADFQNARRRQERQLAEEIERANVRLILRLLPVLDDLDLAFANTPAAVAEDSWVTGLQQIQKKLRGVLEEDGLQEIPVGGEFDPIRHEALASIPSDTVPSGHIIDALRTGYTLQGKGAAPRPGAGGAVGQGMTAIHVSDLPYDVAQETGIRPFDISRDLRPVAELIAEAFAAELDERGKSALREMRTMSHFSGVLGLVNRSTGEFNDLLNGFVWVERGQVVGNITVQRADRYGNRWQIANVAVAPGYRGRGISRRLMEAGLDHAAEAGAQWVVLQVYAGNRVARQLYDSLGFEEVAGVVDLLAAAAPEMPAPPAGDSIQPFSSSDWQPLFDLANQQLGAQSQWWRPIQRAEFQTSFETQIGEWFWQGLGRGRTYRWAVKKAPRFDAALVLQARRWRGDHLLQLWVRPEHYGQYDGILLQRALYELQEYPRWPIRISLPADQRSALELLQGYGFQAQRTLLTLRKRVGGQE